jgi:hypothetical protein
VFDADKAARGAVYKSQSDDDLYGKTRRPHEATLICSSSYS